MAGTTLPLTEPTLVRLDWECNHFGLFAAQLANVDLDDVALAAALRLAVQQRVQLLVWPAASGRDVPREILDEFGGALVDRKATFGRPLQPFLADQDSSPAVEFQVIPYTSTTASAALIELAISAGSYSRFHIDRHFPNEKFEAMYRRWIERSVAKELADAVFVVSLGDQEDLADRPLGGMITLSESGGIASIGLVAVATAVRGIGFGSALLRAAHRWMHERGAHKAQVVTQLANLPACRLYERAGYRLSRLQHYYHFWL